ncbi:MAG TPA: hypothetical protein VMU13_02950 [Candidatus Paceibacterota bacterium]|nr:hypothetical protein [Candidatus Paceibacterota bacterium]
MIEGFVGYLWVKAASLGLGERFLYRGSWAKLEEPGAKDELFMRYLEPNQARGEPRNTWHQIDANSEVQVVWSPEREKEALR